MAHIVLSYCTNVQPLAHIMRSAFSNNLVCFFLCFEANLLKLHGVLHPHPVPFNFAHRDQTKINVQNCHANSISLSALSTRSSGPQYDDDQISNNSTEEHTRTQMHNHQTDNWFSWDLVLIGSVLLPSFCAWVERTAEILFVSGWKVIWSEEMELFAGRHKYPEIRTFFRVVHGAHTHTVDMSLLR